MQGSFNMGQLVSSSSPSPGDKTLKSMSHPGPGPWNSLLARQKTERLQVLTLSSLSPCLCDCAPCFLRPPPFRAVHCYQVLIAAADPLHLGRLVDSGSMLIMWGHLLSFAG